jgi:hypothetical protein
MLTSLQPFVIAFFVFAGIATVVAVATLTRVAAEVRQSRTASPVVSIAGRSTAVAAGRAA